VKRFFAHPPSALWTGLVRDGEHGPLPGLIVLLTMVAGTVDAVSILRLDHVFVANITGNIIFIGLGITGALGFSFLAPLLVLISFVCGSFAGGLLVRSPVPHRGKALRTAAYIQLGTLVASTGITAASGDRPTSAVRYLLLLVLSCGMGAKSSIVRSVNVPGLTSSVFTTTLTGLASDAPRGGWRDPQFQIRALAGLALLAGAAVGAVLVLRTSLWCPLALTTTVLVVVTWGAQRASGADAPWATSQ
jgi:uncharacterized membrane protein YoaK (UPF0700 family)